VLSKEFNLMLQRVRRMLKLISAKLRLIGRLFS
jgi:hypothetical protein